MSGWDDAAVLAAADRLDPALARAKELASTMSEEHWNIVLANTAAAVDAETNAAAREDPSVLTPEVRLAWSLIRTWWLSERTASMPRPIRRSLPPECGAVYLAEPYAQPWGVFECGVLV
ncbi:MAG: hypothetical protein ABR564_05715, partial [Candidatus Dormibacteria bacterium]